MFRTRDVDAHQLQGRFSAATTAASASRSLCTALILPSGGVLVLHDSQTVTLGAKATFKLPCEDPNPIISPHTPEPFYASISPQIFTLAAATVISYVLVILIFITPRTFFVGGPGGGSGFLGRRGMANGSYGSSLTVGIGRRPLLQKIASITVAISLTIATADTFRVARKQYDQGLTDSRFLVDEVVDSLEIRIVRVISDTFIWLAQVQTLIRLFPRHKEKVTIKWLGFALVLFDTIFSIWDSFGSSKSKTRPRSFQDAVAALSYLFELAISLIYASCVIYYSLSKRRFAFWHPKMRNVCLVALLSLAAVLIPVVFFVIDLSLPKIAGWGEYIRWVGAAAASVVVWEWVERIETLERDERKDGILGREIFDGDEMLDITSSGDGDYDNSRKDSNGANENLPVNNMVARYKRVRARFPTGKRRRAANGDGMTTGTDDSTIVALGASSAPDQNMAPHQVLAPPSRSDTTSAASTVYAIRYHNLNSPSPALIHESAVVENRIEEPEVANDRSEQSTSNSDPSNPEKEAEPGIKYRNTKPTATALSTPRQIWQIVPNPFKRRKVEPPAEVADAQANTGMRRSPTDHTQPLRDRLGAFALVQKERFSSRGDVQAPALGVTVIPAPKMNQRTWSPDDRRRSSTRDIISHHNHSISGVERSQPAPPSVGQENRAVRLQTPIQETREPLENVLAAHQIDHSNMSNRVNQHHQTADVSNTEPEDDPVPEADVVDQQNSVSGIAMPCSTVDESTLDLSDPAQCLPIRTTLASQDTEPADPDTGTSRERSFPENEQQFFSSPHGSGSSTIVPP